MVQVTANSGRAPCLVAAPRWDADARARTIAAAGIASVPASTRATPIVAGSSTTPSSTQAACWVTQAMKFSSPVPVSSAIVCPCPQMVAKSTLPAPAC